MSTNIPEMIDGLLIKVILREASPEEARIVEDWAGASEVNRLYFDDFRRIWNESRELAMHSTVSEEDAWGRFRERVAAGTSAPIRRGRLISLRWMQVAAIFIMLAAGSWLFYRLRHTETQDFVIRSGNAVLRDTLVDGTIVTLNKYATLKGTHHFGEKDRQVELEGEAFFEVHTDKDRPFSVTTKGAEIRVMGTSFNVRNSGQGTEVIVETGQVLVGRNRDFVRVEPHERVVVAQETGAPKKEWNTDALYNYYRTREFVCNGTPLQRLVEVLNTAYGVSIQLSDSSIGRLPLTTTFRDQSLDEILLVVKKTLNLHIDKKEDRILLY